MAKPFPNYLRIHYEKLFLVDDFFENHNIQIKNLNGCKFVRAVKQSEFKRCIKLY